VAKGGDFRPSPHVGGENHGAPSLDECCTASWSKLVPKRSTPEGSGFSPTRGAGAGEPDTGSSGSRLARAARGLPLALPAIAVVAVALAVLVIGRPHSVIGVRVRGGPSAGLRSLSVRLTVVERLGDVERPLRGRRIAVDADRGGTQATWSGALDAEGAAEVTLAPPGDGAVRVSVHLDRRLIADGGWTLSVDDWKRAARRRGGWVERRFDDGVVLRAAAERGVFAVPYTSGLWVEASRDGHPLAIDAHGDGADVARASNAASGAHALPPGRLRYVVTPREHAAVVVVSAPGNPAAELEVSLAVVPGALFAELRDGELVVRSPVVHERAYVAIVGEKERIAGATVPLEADANGASGVLRGLALPDGVPLWAVVSSEPELRSASLVGWPLRPDVAAPEPPATFDVGDALLLDSVPAAVAREEERVRKVRFLAALIAVVALCGAAAAVASRAGRARDVLTAHLEGAGADQDTTARVSGTGGASVWGVVAAVLSVALAALLIALFTSYAR